MKSGIWASSIWSNPRVGLLYFTKWLKKSGGCGIPADGLWLLGSMVGGPGDLGRVSEAVFFGKCWDSFLLLPMNHLTDESFSWRPEMTIFLWRNQRKTVKDNGSGHCRPLSSQNSEGPEQRSDQKANFTVLVSRAHKCSKQSRAYPAVGTGTGQEHVFFLLKVKSDSPQCPICVLSH